jgi:hypothetical protein
VSEDYTRGKVPIETHDERIYDSTYRICGLRFLPQNYDKTPRHFINRRSLQSFGKAMNPTK